MITLCRLYLHTNDADSKAAAIPRLVRALSAEGNTVPNVMIGLACNKGTPREQVHDSCLSFLPCQRTLSCYVAGD